MNVEAILEEIKKLSPEDLQWLNLQLLQWYGSITEDLHLSEDEAKEARKTAHHLIGEYIA